MQDDLLQQRIENARLMRANRALQRQLRHMSSAYPPENGTGTSPPETLEERICRLEADNAALQAQLDAVLSSSSWRVTYPLRLLAARFRTRTH